MMDCKIALRLMEVCRPSGEDLLAPELVSLRDHLEECPDCLGRLRTRQAFDTQVVRTLRSVAVPERLRERILDRLDRSAIRARRLRVVPYAAAALLLVGSGLFLWRAAPTWGLNRVIPIEALANKLELGEEWKDERNAPAQIHDADGITAWCVRELEKLDLHGRPPQDWPVSGLMGIAQASLEGRRVAVFRYVDPSSPGNPSAFVFAWPREQLPVQGIGSSPPSKPIRQTGDLTVFAWFEGDMNYIAVFKAGEPRQWQLLRQRQGLT